MKKVLFPLITFVLVLSFSVNALAINCPQCYDLYYPDNVLYLACTGQSVGQAYTIPCQTSGHEKCTASA